MAGLLEGIKVISMGQVVAIPAASSTLADWGAEVIKLEPLTGEMLRGTRRAQGTETGDKNINWTIQLLNRNSKGLAVDLKTEAGREIVYKLVRKVDVFMSNYERNSVNKLRMDYATLSRLNPRLIYAFVSGYGAVGPDKDERGFDYSAGWARSGIMYMIGQPDSVPVPQRPGMMDSITGAHVVGGVCAALLSREKTGKGQEIEVSLYHAAVWTLGMDIQSALSGRQLMKSDRTKAGNPLFNSYRTSDNRWFWLAMLQPDPCWPGFCRAIERPELIDDPRFCDLETRQENCEELINIIETILAARTMAEWEKRFKEHDCVYGRIQSPIEVTTDPQALANDFFVEFEYPGVRKLKLVNTPVKFSQNPAVVQTPAPEVGQHTEEIMLELGYSWDDISNLKEQSVIL